MASTLPPFSPQQVEQVARIIGETADGLTGPEIGGILGHLGFPNEGATQTKWKRLYNSLAHLQNRHQVGNHTVQFINAVMRPEGYVAKREQFQARRERLNTVLAFAGYYVRDDGKVASTPKATTL